MRLGDASNPLLFPCRQASKARTLSLRNSEYARRVQNLSRTGTCNSEKGADIWAGLLCCCQAVPLFPCWCIEMPGSICITDFLFKHDKLEPLLGSARVPPDAAPRCGPFCLIWAFPDQAGRCFEPFALSLPASFKGPHPFVQKLGRCAKGSDLSRTGTCNSEKGSDIWAGLLCCRQAILLFPCWC